MASFRRKPAEQSKEQSSHQRSSNTLEDVFVEVGSKLGRSQEDVKPLLEIMAANWFESPESLREVSVDDLVALGVPWRFAKELLTTIASLPAKAFVVPPRQAPVKRPRSPIAPPPATRLRLVEKAASSQPPITHFTSTRPVGSAPVGSWPKVVPPPLAAHQPKVVLPPVGSAAAASSWESKSSEDRPWRRGLPEEISRKQNSWSKDSETASRIRLTEKKSSTSSLDALKQRLSGGSGSASSQSWSRSKNERSHDQDQKWKKVQDWDQQQRRIPIGYERLTGGQLSDIIGFKAAHFRYIREETGVELRLCGRGCKQYESDESPYLLLLGDDYAKWKKAERMVRDLLENVFPKAKAEESAHFKENQHVDDAADSMHRHDIILEADAQVGRIIGVGGKNFRAIFASTGAWVKFHKASDGEKGTNGDDGKARIVVTCKEKDGLDAAVEQLEDLIARKVSPTWPYDEAPPEGHKFEFRHRIHLEVEEMDMEALKALVCGEEGQNFRYIHDVTGAWLFLKGDRNRWSEQLHVLLLHDDFEKLEEAKDLMNEILDSTSLPEGEKPAEAGAEDSTESPNNPYIRGRYSTEADGYDEGRSKRW